MMLVSSDYTTYNDLGPGWASYGGMTPLVWQYTSSASLNGRSPVDFNAFKGSLIDFESYVTTGAASGSEPVLRLGDIGAAVIHLQQRLKVWGLNINADGDFGPDTLNAVKSFQSQHRITVDGVVGPQTWAELNKNPGEPSFPAPTGLNVKTVSVEIDWNPVVVKGSEIQSYTVEAFGINGHLYVREVVSESKATLTGLNHGWIYNVIVWANGSPSAPPHANIQITV
jgi:hypothetical protein